MMTLVEAEKILNVDPAINKIVSVAESTNYFIFNVVPVTAKNDEDLPFAPPIAVDKRSGKTLRFNPMRFPKAELDSIRLIR